MLSITTFIPRIHEACLISTILVAFGDDRYCNKSLKCIAMPLDKSAF